MTSLLRVRLRMSFVTFFVHEKIPNDCLILLFDEDGGHSYPLDAGLAVSGHRLEDCAGNNSSTIIEVPEVEKPLRSGKKADTLSE